MNATLTLGLLPEDRADAAGAKVLRGARKNLGFAGGPGLRLIPLVSASA